MHVSAVPGMLTVATKPTSHNGESEPSHAQMCAGMIVFLISFSTEANFNPHRPSV